MTDLSDRIIEIILSIPKGKVLTYGSVAALAGCPRAARQVSWLLKTQTDKLNLPWHRVINSKGKISIKDFNGYHLQKILLEEEGIIFDENETVNLKYFMWNGFL